VQGCLRDFREGPFGWALEEGANFGDGAASGRIGVEASASDLGKGCWNSGGQNGFGIAGGVPDGELLGERFDESDAEGPNVSLRRGKTGCVPRCDVDVVGEKFGRGFTGGKQSVRRDLDFVFDDKDVGGLEVAVDVPGVVQVVEGAEDGNEHLASFIRGQRTLRNYLGKELLGQIVDDVDARFPVHVRPAEVVNPGEV